MSEENNCVGDRVSRRSIIKNTAALGMVSVSGKAIGASPAEKSVDLESVLRHSTVQKLMGEIPGLKLYREEATIYGSDGSIIAIPANYGKLVAAIPQNRGSNANDSPDRDPTNSNTKVAASFYFEEWVPGVDDAWVKGTKGRLTVSDKEMIFQRSATGEEKRWFLNEINQTDFQRDQTEIAVIPDRGVVQFSHKNKEKKQIETLTAVHQSDQKGPRRGDTVNPTRPSHSLKVVDQNTMGSSLKSSDIKLDGEYNCEMEKSIPDLAYCVFDYVDCAWCVGLGFSGPVAIACWIVICLDGGVSVAAEFLTEIGCVSAGVHVAPCLANILEEHADQIPQPPSAPEPPDIPDPIPNPPNFPSPL